MYQKSDLELNQMNSKKSDARKFCKLSDDPFKSKEARFLLTFRSLDTFRSFYHLFHTFRPLFPTKIEVKQL